MNIQHIAAFSDGLSGGNPAGVSIDEVMPTPTTMQQTARKVGFSETVFAAREGENWRTRYFSPQSEVPFCGHATIALGAALALRYGDQVFKLQLNNAMISVEGKREGKLFAAALQSPPTRSKPPSQIFLQHAMDLFDLKTDDLDDKIPPAEIHGGADHLVLALGERTRLAAMRYELEPGRALMDEAGWVTIALVHAQDNRTFNARNAFASGGVIEDPATGAAAAAFAGYLRDLHWPHGGAITITQGEDMGMVSRIHADIPNEPGSSIRVSGTARLMAQ
jgi:PhzF family phenazine biosynthesis protein